MNMLGVMQIALFAIVLTALVKPLGGFMAKVFQGERTWLSPVLGPVERGIYRLCGIDASSETTWKRYAIAVLLFNLIGFLAVYSIQLAQGVLPLNPQAFAGVEAKSAFNTAVSFASNTNWQGYGGESTMSYFTQMLALNVQNFLSAASGMAVLVALIRGFSRRQASQIGNFYVDMTRGTLYVLVPLALVLALALVSQGVVQNFSEYKTVELVEPVVMQSEQVTQQTIPLGPAASQVAIKQLGTNGGGFFNVNSAHPLENPTPLSNFLEVLAILLIPAALCYTFGRMVNDTRQGWAVYAAMMIIFLPLTFGVFGAEQAGNPRFDTLGVDQASSATHSGGNMEGKEVRFGIANSALWAAVTTAASNGSVNSMHDSYTPLGGLVPMWLMQLGEVVFGGAGSGLYGMLMFAIVAVFIAGLMVGRTPEYLGKKIEAYEVKMASLVLLLPCVVVLIGTAIASAIPAGTSSVANPGAHGFSEILYAFSSAGNNNGSAFGGLSANTPFYNIALGVTMWISRFWLMIPVLAIAGSLAAKRNVAITAGTLPTHTPLFIAMLIGVVLMVGALTFLPSLALGPIVEHLQMIGKG
ncbi:potassium-transporting ATPase potassium-binding subunit [Steroidobacter agaridevorans]|uniref:Potassium-transporting ATPase potassium-binding subunit n=1 Tax=Steroidobacter agaridevorans TaxID=2695856 RepID=A0A829YBE0_9GAMM|nr:potassium-transporting ATPase subunit KdpA [Steroidobacter agaridevorans]GFE79996.1 potassium-transporting ATPase potassium-binding subunit [Steroidobacter agaridevorans]